jgi:hypothetical protein
MTSAIDSVVKKTLLLPPKKRILSVISAAPSFHPGDKKSLQKHRSEYAFTGEKRKNIGHATY